MFIAVMLIDISSANYNTELSTIYVSGSNFHSGKNSSTIGRLVMEQLSTARVEGSGLYNRIDVSGSGTTRVE